MKPPVHTSQFSIHNSQFHSPATSWAEIFVSALAASGLRRVCIAPGSRSTPLTLAFDAHPDVEVFLHLDERSAGFFALGMALATDAPVALVCTSGTAVANFLPAIVEARMSHVPLLILTADRPPELRHSGANQTIDQVKIYGDQVLWSVDAPLPETEPSPVLLRHLQTLAARAYATANGITKGPVHVNFPFRKPLEPVDSNQLSVSGNQLPITDHRLPLTAYRSRMMRGELIPTRAQVAELAALLQQHERGLIVCGPRCPGGNFAAAVAGLSQITGYPILADPLSGVRWGRHVSGTAVSGAYETYLQSQTGTGADPFGVVPDIVLRFGAVPTSKWLNAYLSRIEAAHRIHVRENGIWADDSHLTTLFLQANEELLCYELAHQVPPRMETAWTKRVMAVETTVWQALDDHLFEPYLDAAAVADTLALMPEYGRLFCGNSLPVRHLDQFGRRSTTPLAVYGNRGASGIDGNVSTALGIAAAGSSPLVAILGDITFYHDLNGLLALRNAPAAARNVTFILLNNNGGSIFRRLPVQKFEPPFTDLFLTPHDLDFSGVLATYGLAHVVAGSRADFRTALSNSLQNEVPTVIEVRTDGAADEARRQELVEMIIGVKREA